MEKRDISKSQPQSLARMMDLDHKEQLLWKPEELGAILQHQLAAPIDFDFSYHGNMAQHSVEKFSSADGAPIKTFRDLFEHPHPPVELLELTKQFAKRCRNSRDGPLPDEIATIIYFLSIVSATTKCRRRISKLDDQSLRYALKWALAQPWLDKSTRDLLEEGYRAVKATGSPPESD